jgi:glycosyltransferase involved in cell wall biosynthesis
MNIIQANKFYYLRGGAEKYMLDLSDWLTKNGNRAIPFAMQHQSNLKTIYSDYFPTSISTTPSIGVSGLRTVGRMMYSLQARRKMATLINDTGADLCHVHNIYTQLSPSILDTLTDQKVPTVMTVHDHHLVSPSYNVWAKGCGPDFKDYGVLKATISKFHKDSFAASFAQALTYKFHKILDIYNKNINTFITPSKYMKNQMVKAGFDKGKIVVNNYGMDTAHMNPSFSHDGYFLFVGRLNIEKGIETIIKLAEITPDIKYKIVGRGVDMDYLHELADGLDNIEFLGFRTGDALAKLYKGACAVLLPSYVHEVFPLVLLEAMAYGKPVIASDVGGIPEIVNDRLTGFIAHPTDIRAWVEAVLRLYHDSDFHKEMSKNARLRIEKDFNIKDHYRRLMDTYSMAQR